MPIVGSFAGVSARAYGAGAGGIQIGDFESIQTITAGSGGVADIEFTSIPSTYKHLQIRALLQTNRTSYVVDVVKLRVNSDTATNYSWHRLRGGYDTTPSTISSGEANANYITCGDLNSGVSANSFSVAVIDILDYANTNKFKTVRGLTGFDVNGTTGTDSYGGTANLISGNWRNTNAITSIKMFPTTGTLFNQYSSFALYGVNA